MKAYIISDKDFETETYHDLFAFVSSCLKENDFEIEPIYTGKAFFALYHLAKNNFFEKGDTIVLIHTGGIM